MKKYALGLLITAGTLLAAGCYPNQPNTYQTTTTKVTVTSQNAVAISNYSYHPPKIVIAVGQTVTWVNHDSVTHTVMSKFFDSGKIAIAPGGFYSYQFNQPGTYHYYSPNHKMTGVVVVK